MRAFGFLRDHIYVITSRSAPEKKLFVIPNKNEMERSINALDSKR
jgi:hypothetical protein